ncbi:alpha/beta hydrolase [Aureibaculum marinum]|uniref:Alpha/beta hydrolase n=1 Tax=Aureibaculum marinum TaxID=2487930 RepID=A0A3N4NJ06_9FLAO|nr:alpha/beta hydrolase-fold protein [Aureibaculum marinum]RPD96201.1 alpha/beta hydrolase [Aureibaculum marinum]
MKKILFFLLIVILIISCKVKGVVYNDPIPQHDSLTILSKFVNEERVINIWTPPNYNNSTDSFPVLYMPDGGIKEDFPHIANTLNKLLSESKIPPMVLVGIENTERGRDLTGFSEAEYDKQFCPVTDGAKNFRAFISEELIPEINRKYRTNSRKGIIGESLAGLFVMETFFTKPNTFDFYIAMDPSLWWNNHYLAKNADSLLSKFPDKNLKLWFTGSSAEDISKFTKSVEKTLKTSAPPKLTWKYSDKPNEKHNTIFRATKENALIWTLTE